MKNYKIVIQYDGSRYNGWQRQGNSDNTIQGKIETVLTKMVEHQVEIHGSGRTDAGVHALCQVANFKIDTTLKESEIQKYLNTYLPSDIAVISCEQADDRFHARLNAQSKKYTYRIWNSAVPNVFERKFMYTYEEDLNLESMITASKYFIGEHDFKAFCSNKRFKKSTVRTIYEINIDKIGNEVKIEFYGNGFLYNMVRILTGTLLEVGIGKISPDDIPNIIESLNRECAGITMPPQGLCLAEVHY